MAVGPSSSLTLVGTLQELPTMGTPSGSPNPFTIPINEAWTLAHSGSPQNFDLVTDSPQAVSLLGLPGAQATHLFIRVTGGHVNVTLTSAAGTAQVVPVNQIALIVSTDQPFTAISLTRSPAVETSVQVYVSNGS